MRQTYCGSEQSRHIVMMLVAVTVCCCKPLRCQRSSPCAAARRVLKCVCNSIAQLLNNCPDSANVGDIIVRHIFALSNILCCCLVACLHALLQKRSFGQGRVISIQPARSLVARPEPARAMCALNLTCALPLGGRCSSIVLFYSDRLACTHVMADASRSE